MAAKFAQAVRMLAARACCPGLNIAGTGALGRSNRYWVSAECVAAGGSWSVKRSGAVLSLNS